MPEAWWILATPHTCWCPECQTPSPNRKLSGICWFVLQRQLSGRSPKAWCPSLKFPLSHKGTPGSPIQSNHFTDTWPVFSGDKKKQGTTQASLSCCIQQEKSLKMRRIWMSFIAFWMLFTTKGTAGTNQTGYGATHRAMQILLLQPDIHKNWI